MARRFSGGVAYTALGVNLPGYAALYDRTAFMHDDNVSQELQLHGSTLGDRLSYVGGLYYFREWGNQQYATTTYFVPSNTRFDILTNSYAAFGQLGFKITPALTLSLGGRYTQDCKSIDALVDTSPVNRKDNWQNFVPKVGLDWQIASQVMAYASLSEGFKAGGYNGLAGSAAQLNSPMARPRSRPTRSASRASSGTGAPSSMSRPSITIIPASSSSS